MGQAKQNGQTGTQERNATIGEIACLLADMNEEQLHNMHTYAVDEYREPNHEAEAVSLSTCSDSGIRQGKKTLFSVMEYAWTMMTAWNRSHPEHAQHPVFRADMIGTVTFSVRDETPYMKAPVHLVSEHYYVYDVRSISTAAVRRLTAFLQAAG
jgi:hypothetical protein